MSITMNGQASHGPAVKTEVVTKVATLTDVVKRYPLPRRSLLAKRLSVEAVAGVSLDVSEGQAVGLVGESGSGKSTIARLLMRLVDVTEGKIELCGTDVTSLRGEALRKVRRNAQMVFQDPYSSFDPQAPIVESVGEPLQTHFKTGTKDRAKRAAELLDLVGLSRGYLDRYPSELSGGQLQRAAIARALAVEPRLLVLDEPVSALDVSTQAQVINLLQDLQQELGVAYLFIAHDLSVVQHISQDIAVMYLGKIIERGPADVVYTQPAHPYTAALLSAIPIPDPVVQRARTKLTIQGDIPSPANPPSGCRFRTRCPFVMDICSVEEPPAYVTPAGATVHCHLHQHGPKLEGQSVQLLDKPSTEAAKISRRKSRERP
ncbi:MAG: hypothetical protein QOF60_2718 [Actinomycetota bacterium]|nr:hypothetical protein [Actinomycetota bacterium]